MFVYIYIHVYIFVCIYTYTYIFVSLSVSVRCRRTYATYPKAGHGAQAQWGIGTNGSLMINSVVCGGSPSKNHKIRRAKNNIGYIAMEKDSVCGQYFGG